MRRCRAQVGHKRNLLDQRPKHFGNCSVVLFVLKVLAKPAEPILIDPCHVWMQQGGWLVRIRQKLNQLRLVRFPFLGLVLELGRG